jgi:hypothetical protein
MLVGDLNYAIVKEDGKPNQKKLLVEYFVSSLHTHNVYAMHFICEALNLINVVGQAYFMDYFLDGEFSTYGSDVIRYAEMELEGRADPMSRVFPEVTKCIVHKYGLSGTMQKYDGICVLPLNVNKKIFVFLWFWFMFLSVLTGLELLYPAVVILTPQVRMYLLLAC